MVVASEDASAVSPNGRSVYLSAAARIAVLDATDLRQRQSIAVYPTGSIGVLSVDAKRDGQFDFSDYETATGWLWKLAGCRDYWFKYERRPRDIDGEPKYDAITPALVPGMTSTRMRGLGVVARVTVGAPRSRRAQAVGDARRSRSISW